MKQSNLYQIVRILIDGIRRQEKQVASEEVDRSWRLVESRILHEHKRRQMRRRVLYGAVAAAALLAGIVCYWAFYGMSPVGDGDAIMRFAMSKPVSPDSVDSVIRLMIPGQKEVALEGTGEADIVNSQTGVVTVNSDTVGQVMGKEETSEQFNQLIIPKGRRTRLLLSDGTRMWVNAGTRVVYPVRFRESCREIYVEGEVYLDVSHDVRSPFLVRTRDFTVQVLGTAFNVSAYPSETRSEVVLVRGSIDVERPQQNPVRLLPGQLVDISGGQVSKPRFVDVEPYICWVHNMLMYTDESLIRVFEKLSLYYGTEFVTDQKVASLHVTGKLDLKEQLEDVLHTIAFSAPLRYERQDGKIIVKLREY